MSSGKDALQEELYEEILFRRPVMCIKHLLTSTH